MDPRRFFRAAAGLLAALLAAAGYPVPAHADPIPPLRFAVLSVRAAEDRAVAHSPDVDTARANVDAAAAALAQARGVNGLSVIAGYTVVPQSGGAPNVTWAQRLGSYQLQATLGDIAAYSPLVQSAAASLRQAVADELTAERSERLKLVGLYYTAVQARVVTLAKRDAIAAAEDFENGVRDDYDAKKAPYLDLLRAQVALAHARADFSAAAGLDANATDALARELELRAADLRDTIAETDISPPVPSDDAAIAQAFAQRPEVRSADANVEAVRSALAAARRAVIPPITISGGYIDGVDAGTVIGAPALSASVQIPLSGIGHARVAAQAAALRTAEAKRTAVRRALAIEVGSAARTAAAAILARAETAASLEASTSVLKYALEEYKTVKTEGLSVKDARDIYDQAVIDDIAAGYAVLAAQATLDVELSP
jgi:outer membrane protein TolC